MNPMNTHPDGNSAVQTWTRQRPEGMASRVYLDAEPKLLWSPDTVLRVHTERGIWVTHPRLALWIPARSPNRYVTCGEGRVCSFLVRGATVSWIDRCLAARITPRLRALLLDVAARGHHGSAGPRGGWHTGAEARLCPLLEELEVTPLTPLADPFLPVDARLLPLVEVLRGDPADDRSLAEWAELLRLSPRTLTRLFRSHMGQPFGVWRRQVRLLLAVERLAQGDDVRSAAGCLGYRSVSMFVSIFRRTLGVTPARYFGMPSAGSRRAGRPGTPDSSGATPSEPSS
jgi:AraC-like DNA-binding protein